MAKSNTPAVVKNGAEVARLEALKAEIKSAAESMIVEDSETTHEDLLMQMLAAETVDAILGGATGLRDMLNKPFRINEAPKLRKGEFDTTTGCYVVMQTTEGVVTTGADNVVMTCVALTRLHNKTGSVFPLWVKGVSVDLDGGKAALHLRPVPKSEVVVLEAMLDQF